MYIFNNNNNNFTNFNNNNNFRFIDSINSEYYCEKQQLLQFNDEIQQQCILMQSPIIPNKFQFKSFINQINLKNLIISKYLNLSNLGYLRDEWIFISILLFTLVPIIGFLISNKWLTPYLKKNKKQIHSNQFLNYQYINENNLNQLYHHIIRGIIGLYFTVFCFLNMLNKTYQENLNFIVFSFLIFKLTDMVILSLYKRSRSSSSGNKLLYIHHLISFFSLYFSIYLDKEGLKYIYLLIFDEFLNVINVTLDLFNIFKINSNYKFFISIGGLCFISMTAIPKQIWILYDSVLINPLNYSSGLIALSLLIVVFFEILYSLKFIKEIVNSYSKISFT